jgi:outer membrane protein assembly factor BamA
MPRSELFLAGGGTTVRGYDEESLGPRVGSETWGGLALIVLNTELRLPLFWRLAGAFFLDAGNAWADYRQISVSRFTRAWTDSDYSPLDVAYGIGVGLRFETIVGPVRLDYGLKVGRGQRDAFGSTSAWHFALGQAF